MANETILNVLRNIYSIGLQLSKDSFTHKSID